MTSKFVPIKKTEGQPTHHKPSLNRLVEEKGIGIAFGGHGMPLDAMEAIGCIPMIGASSKSEDVVFQVMTVYST